MSNKISILALFILLTCKPVTFYATPAYSSSFLNYRLDYSEFVELPLCAVSKEDENSRPSPLLRLFRAKQRKNQKLTAAILAFPFPFGIVGLHRIYLGSAPFVPVVYIASLGGVFGVLPLIDFFVILHEKDMERFVNNQKVFMWVK